MKVLVLAGGFDQIALIEELKSRGHDVILADYLDNPPAKKYAKKHYQISTLDIESVCNLAKQENVDIVATACTDQALLTVARVSEILDLPCYITYQKALNVTNKEYMKEVFFANDIPTSKCLIIKGEQNLEIKLSGITYPAVVKPCDCNSSKGVKKVNSKQEAVIALKEALSLSRSKTSLIEEFKEGVELSVDAWIDLEGAKVLSSSTTSKIKNNSGSFTIYQSKYPVNISTTASNKIKEVANKIASAFDLRDCPLLIQMIVNGDDISVIEFSARMGGGTKYRLIKEMSGVDIMKVYVNRILGVENQYVEPVPSKKCIELNYVYSKNSIFDSLLNFKEAKKSGMIVDYFSYKTSGSKIEKATTSSDRVAGFLIEADSKEEISKKRREIVDFLDVLDINGNTMMIKDIYFEKQNGSELL